MGASTAVWCRMSAFGVQNKRDEVGNKMLYEYISVLYLIYSRCAFRSYGLCYSVL